MIKKRVIELLVILAVNAILLAYILHRSGSTMHGVPYSMNMRAFAQDCSTRMVEADDTANRQIGVFYIRLNDSASARRLAEIHTIHDRRGYRPAFAMFVDSTCKFFQDLQSTFIIPCK